MTPRRPTRDDPRGRRQAGRSDRSSASRSDRDPGGRAGVIVKGLAALLFTLGFIAGVPYLLIRIGAFPTSIPDPGTLWRSAMGPDLTGHGVFVVLAALVWIGWAWFTLSVLKETVAAIRSRGRRPARTARRHSARTSHSVQPAAILVAAIVAMFVAAPLLTAGAPPAAAAGHPGADPAGRPSVVATATHTAGISASAHSVTLSSTSSASTSHTSTSRTSTHQGTGSEQTTTAKSSKKAAAVATTTYTVRRYDNLWTIAEKQLGDPTRYREIVNLNPHLQHDTTIHAGETLKLPQHHAQGTNRVTAPVPPASTEQTSEQTIEQAGQQAVEQVRVQLHDTVSEISAEHGVTDWHTVWEANKGRTEPGGKRFTDPDHIEVGWTLAVPVSSQHAAAPSAPDGVATEAPAVGRDGSGAATAETAPAAPAQTAPAPAAPAQAPGTAIGATHRPDPVEQQDSRTEAGVSTPTPAPSLAATAPGSPVQPEAGHAGADTSAGISAGVGAAASVADGRPLATVAGYVAGGSVLAAGMLAALVLVRRQQWRIRRPGRTVAATPPQLIPIERSIVTAASPSADETERIDQVLRRVAATDITPLHVAAVQLTARDITLHLSEPAALPAPWRLTGEPDQQQPAPHTPDNLSRISGESDGVSATSGVVWTFPAGQEPEAAGADPKIVDAIAPYPTLVHVGSDADSAWLLNLEQLGGLVLTGDRDRSLALARVLSAQMGVNAWAELVTVTMLGFGEELVQTAPSRLRYAPLNQAGPALASATGSAVTTADYTDEQVGMPVVEARRTAANDEAWGVHVLVTAPPVIASPDNASPDTEQAAGPDTAVGEDGYRDQVAELLAVLHERAGTTAAAAVVIDEHTSGDGFPGATVAHVDANGTLTLPGVGLTVQATGWDEETSRGVGMLMAHLRNAPDESVPDAHGDQPWHQLTDSAGALRADLVQPRSTPTVHDSSRAAGANTLPLADQAYLDVAATTVEDLQILAPTVPAEVLDQVMAADPTLDADVAAWFDPDSGRAKLAVLGPVTLTTTQTPPKRVAYNAELAAYLAFRPQGVTADQVCTSFGLSGGSARSYLSTLREYLGKDPLTGADYLAGAKDSAAGKSRGVGIYQTCGVLLDADLFRRLRSRGQARGPAGLEDYATALRLVTGPPFSQMREEGGAWLLEGDRVDQHLTVAIVDVAHLLATSALAAGDTATARAAVDISRLAAPDEEAPRLDSAAVDCADGHAAQARRTLVEQVCNRSDDGEAPMDLSPRTRQILAHHRDWLSRAS